LASTANIDAKGFLQIPTVSSHQCDHPKSAKTHFHVEPLSLNAVLHLNRVSPMLSKAAHSNFVVEVNQPLMADTLMGSRPILAYRFASSFI
jgi:hypothetical protein